MSNFLLPCLSLSKQVFNDAFHYYGHAYHYYVLKCYIYRSRVNALWGGHTYTCMQKLQKKAISRNQSCASLWPACAWFNKESSFNTVLFNLFVSMFRTLLINGLVVTMDWWPTLEEYKHNNYLIYDSSYNGHLEALSWQYLFF